MTGNQDVAKDMVQEAFFQAWTAIDTLQDPEKALPWLLTILRRAIYREQRCQYRQAETVAQLRILDSDQKQSDAYRLLDIYNALETISPNHREVFLLHHLHGFSYAEISEQLSIPKGTIMSRLSRAREALLLIEQASQNDNVVPIEKIKRGPL